MDITNYPICINCKYFVEEAPGGTKSICGLTAVDPVTGKENARKARPASVYRNKNYPCGPSGKFFIAGKVKAEPKIVKAEPPKAEPKPEVKTVKVDVPEVNQVDSTEEGEFLPLKEGEKRRRRRPKAE